MDLDVRVIEHIATLSTGKWNMELNLVEWCNNGKESYDIRSWNEDHTRCGKGVSLSKEEAIALRDALNSAM